jgi:hypothetical protein
LVAAWRRDVDGDRIAGGELLPQGFIEQFVGVRDARLSIITASDVIFLV